MSFIADEYPEYICLNCSEEFDQNWRQILRCPCCGSTRVIVGEEQARNEGEETWHEQQEDMRMQRELRKEENDG